MMVGEDGPGSIDILWHARLTRLDVAAGAAGLMRQALPLARRPGLMQCLPSWG
jgi:hypothetical protein